MGNPLPFQQSEFTNTIQLVILMNGIGIYSQQPFLCKGHYISNNKATNKLKVMWQAKQDITFQYSKLVVKLYIHLLILNTRLFDFINTIGLSINQIEGAAYNGGLC